MIAEAALIATLNGEAQQASLLNEVKTQMVFLETTGQLVKKFDIPGDDKKAELNRLLAYVRKEVPVFHFPTSKSAGLLGVTVCRRGCFIILDSETGSNGQLATLVHEYVHLKIEESDAAEEAVAEAVTWLVLKELGYGTTQAISYLKMIPEEVLTEELTVHEKDIRAEAARLLKAIRG